MRLDAADIAIERQAGDVGRRLGDGERDAQNGVGAEPRLVRRAVERDHRCVDLDLILRVKPAQGVENIAIDAFDRLEHALAEKARLVAVAQFDRFMRAGRGARRHRRAAKRAIFQRDIDFDRGIAALSRISRAAMSIISVMRLPLGKNADAAKYGGFLRRLRERKKGTKGRRVAFPCRNAPSRVNPG